VFRDSISTKLRETARVWTDGGANYKRALSTEAMRWHNNLDIGWYLAVDVLDIMVQHGQFTGEQADEYREYFDKFSCSLKWILLAMASSICLTRLCCAQQTGMHILVVEALLIAIYSTWGTSKYLYT
jgi:hypothetical protein